MYIQNFVPLPTFTSEAMICETRWIKSGGIRLSTEEAEAPHTGVGMMLSREAAEFLIGWELKDRCCQIQSPQLCIMPQQKNETEEEVKEDFCERLQTVVNGRHEKQPRLHSSRGKTWTGYHEPQWPASSRLVQKTT